MSLVCTKCHCHPTKLYGDLCFWCWMYGSGIFTREESETRAQRREDELEYQRKQVSG